MTRSQSNNHKKQTKKEQEGLSILVSPLSKNRPMEGTLLQWRKSTLPLAILVLSVGPHTAGHAGTVLDQYGNAFAACILVRKNDISMSPYNHLIHSQGCCSVLVYMPGTGSTSIRTSRFTAVVYRVVVYIPVRPF